MFTQKEQDEIINDFWILSRLEVTSGKVGKSEISVNVRIVRNMIAIALYTSCHCQKILLIISMALLISAMSAKRRKKKRKI